MSTFAKGLEGVVAAETRMSFIDGAKGVLEYVGIPIGELAANSTFEETVFLLWNTRLPKAEELKDFTRDLRARYEPHKELVKMILNTPKDAQPMHVLRTLISALSLFDKEPNANDPASARAKALSVLAQTPAILAYFDRHRRGLAIVPPDKNMTVAENFLYMLNGTKPTPTMTKAVDVCLILHADHGLNNSTFTARVITSTKSDVYSAITGAIGSLRGPSHGGANEGVMVMLNEIPSLDAVEGYVKAKLAKKDPIMGFGHRIYKAYDPRASFLKNLAKQLATDTGNLALYEKSMKIEQVMATELSAKGIYPNVDFYSATTYHCIGLKLDLFTPMFVIARIGGWAGHIIEQLSDNRLYRPSDQYIGEHNQPYVPIANR